ncbi:hypothetical protein PC119_g23882 [Phytophthora cactorum]|nr:hypothetical protein PC119_g23882 [Phytophthora cactorum]
MPSSPLETLTKTLLKPGWAHQTLDLQLQQLSLLQPLV